MPKTYRNPHTSQIRTVADPNGVQAAALEKLGWHEITADDIRSEVSLSVTYQTVAAAKPVVSPAPLPHLVQPVVTEEVKTPEKVGDPVLVVTEQPGVPKGRGA